MKFIFKENMKTNFNIRLEPQFGLFKFVCQAIVTKKLHKI